ncbi:MAG: hypothetical protein KGI78_00505 [Patescibacteria group bacterium]|nr:hypothetical protein [Patescibacteria group bacterium]MDE1943977.1 hypothetical protein [Patescibacteria group bacterium]MDE1944694.1 hypothetical protein [Patescibacteria group bacterium]MDE2057319.1 hypothetical protein [Patescibacteria group bacterium]
MAQVIAEVSPQLKRAIITVKHADGSRSYSYAYRGRLVRIGRGFSHDMYLQPSWGSEMLRSEEEYPFPKLKADIQLIWSARSALNDTLAAIDFDASPEAVPQLIAMANRHLRNPRVFVKVEQMMLIAGRQPGFDWDAKRAGKVGELLKAVRQVPPTHVPP